MSNPYGESSDAGAKSSNGGRVYTIIGAVMGAIALIFCPPLFGIAGIVLGFVGNAKGDKPYGLIVGIGSIVTMVIGMVVGYVVFQNMGN